MFQTVFSSPCKVNHRASNYLLQGNTANNCALPEASRSTWIDQKSTCYHSLIKYTRMLPFLTTKVRKKRMTRKPQVTTWTLSNPPTTLNMPRRKRCFHPWPCTEEWRPCKQVPVIWQCCTLSQKFRSCSIYHSRSPNHNNNNHNIKGTRDSDNTRYY